MCCLLPRTAAHPRDLAERRGAGAGVRLAVDRERARRHRAARRRGGPQARRDGHLGERRDAARRAPPGWGRVRRDAAGADAARAHAPFHPGTRLRPRAARCAHQPGRPRPHLDGLHAHQLPRRGADRLRPDARRDGDIPVLVVRRASARDRSAAGRGHLDARGGRPRRRAPAGRHGAGRRPLRPPGRGHARRRREHPPRTGHGARAAGPAGAAGAGPPVPRRRRGRSARPAQGRARRRRAQPGDRGDPEPAVAAAARSRALAGCPGRGGARRARARRRAERHGLPAALTGRAAPPAASGTTLSGSGRRSRSRRAPARTAGSSPPPTRSCPSSSRRMRP